MAGLDSILNDISLANAGDTLRVNPGWADESVEVTVIPTGRCYRVSPDGDVREVRPNHSYRPEETQ